MAPRGFGMPRAARRSRLLSGHEGGVLSAAFSPDGAQIVTASFDYDGAYLGHRVRQRIDGFARAHRGRCGMPPSVRTEPGSSPHRRTRPRAFGTPRPARRSWTLSGHQGWVLWAAFSPDGTRVVTASADGTARIWDATTGEQLVDSERTPGSGRAGKFQSGRNAASSRPRMTIPRASGTRRPASKWGSLSGHEGGAHDREFQSRRHADRYVFL